MTRTTLLVATRSDDKLREIRQIIDVQGLYLIDLNDAGLPPSMEEEGLEAFDTFEENALAKARYFSRRSGLPVIADDSGLCVDALDGAPGVRSKRFAARGDLAGHALDLANNERLLHALRSVDNARRTARYVCVIAIVTPAGYEHSVRGSVEGVILQAPRGSGGFGYDPLFFLPGIGATFAEIPPTAKNRLSHRGRALRAALPSLAQLPRGASLSSP